MSNLSLIMTLRQLSLFLFLVTLSSAIVSCDADAGADTTPDAASSTDSANRAGVQTGSAADSSIPMTVERMLDSIPLRTPEGRPARYGRRSGRVLMLYSGNLSGSREVVFDNWGLKESRRDSAVPNGKPGPGQFSLLLSTPETFNVIDFAQKSGWTMDNESDDRYLKSDSSTTYSLGEMIFRASGGVRLNDEVVKGYPCKVQELRQGDAATRVWVWQGLIVRERFTSKEMSFTVEIDSAVFDIDIPASTFNVPSGIKLERRSPDMPPGGSQQEPPKGGVIMPPPPAGGRGTNPAPVPIPVPMPGGR